MVVVSEDVAKQIMDEDEDDGYDQEIDEDEESYNKLVPAVVVGVGAGYMASLLF